MTWVIRFAVVVLALLATMSGEHQSPAAPGNSHSVQALSAAAQSAPQWPENISKLLGAPLVAGIATVFIGRWLERRAADTRAKREYCALLKVVADEVHRNLKLECQIATYLHVGLKPTFGMSFLAQNVITVELPTLSRNSDVLRAILSEYYEYQHLAESLDKLDRAADATLEAPTFMKCDDPLFGPSMKKHERYRKEMARVGALARSRIRASWRLYNQIRTELVRMRQFGNVPALADDYLDELHEYFLGRPEVSDLIQKQADRLPAFPKF